LNGSFAVPALIEFGRRLFCVKLLVWSECFGWTTFGEGYSGYGSLICRWNISVSGAAPGARESGGGGGGEKSHFGKILERSEAGRRAVALAYCWGSWFMGCFT